MRASEPLDEQRVAGRALCGKEPEAAANGFSGYWF